MKNPFNYPRIKGGQSDDELAVASIKGAVEDLNRALANAAAIGLELWISVEQLPRRKPVVSVEVHRRLLPGAGPREHK